jgi:hypothetical protein
MGNVVTSTADVLAIIGGGTTLCLGIFGAIRYSRCRTVSCCWNGCILQNEPPIDKKKSEAIDTIVPRTDSAASIMVLT